MGDDRPFVCAAPGCGQVIYLSVCLSLSASHSLVSLLQAKRDTLLAFRSSRCGAGALYYVCTAWLGEVEMAEIALEIHLQCFKILL